MQIVLKSADETLAKAVLRELNVLPQVAAASFALEPHDACRLRYRTESDPGSLMAVLRALHPLPLVILKESSASLSDCDIEITLGGAEPLSDSHITVFGPEKDDRDRAKKRFDALGFSTGRSRRHDVPTAKISHRGASRFALGAIQFVYKKDGVTFVPAIADSDEDVNQINVLIPDSVTQQLPVEERYEINVVTDHPDSVNSVTDRLTTAGFTRSSLRVMTSDEACAGTTGFGVDPGPLKPHGFDEYSARLLTIASQLAQDLGVDRDRFPPLFVDARADSPTLFLPLHAMQSGAKIPLSGSHPERFSVNIFTDDRQVGAKMSRAFRKQGFRVVRKRGIYNTMVGFKIDFSDKVARHPRILELGREIVEDVMIEASASSVPLHIENDDRRGGDLNLHVPAAAFLDGSLERELNNPVIHTVTIAGGISSIQEKLKNELSPMGFQEIGTTLLATDEFPRIAYNRAPSALVERVRAALSEKFQIDLPARQETHLSHNAIRIFLPNRLSSRQSKEPLEMQSQEMAIFETRRLMRTIQANRPFLQVQDELVMVGDVALRPRPGAAGPHVPPPEDFSRFCIDQITAENLRHLSTGVLKNEPTALEGITSTGKSSSILYLAHLLNQPVYRLNLSGQTDVGELVGRFAPDERSGGWHFVEGLLPRAMREGAWVLLDEVNLCESQILERLNSVLESPGSLVLTEYDSRVIRAHRDFRLFATLNPVDSYQGRSAMSAAFRDRWPGYRLVPRAEEQQYHELARWLVYGDRPGVVVAGYAYQTDTQDEPAYPHLGPVESVSGFLARLSSFQWSCESAAESSSGDETALGKDRSEPYVFTRRGFLKVLSHLDEAAKRGPDGLEPAAWEALERYYLARVAPTDQAAIVGLASANGLYPDRWESA